MSNLFVILIVTSCILTFAQEQPCAANECPQYGPEEIEPVLTLLPVPWNCSQYVACDRGVQFFMYAPCPQGLHFNAELMVCDYPVQANCVEICSKPAD